MYRRLIFALIEGIKGSGTIGHLVVVVRWRELGLAHHAISPVDILIMIRVQSITALCGGSKLHRTCIGCTTVSGLHCRRRSTITIGLTHDLRLDATTVRRLAD